MSRLPSSLLSSRPTNSVTLLFVASLLAALISANHVRAFVPNVNEAPKRQGKTSSGGWGVGPLSAEGSDDEPELILGGGGGGGGVGGGSGSGDFLSDYQAAAKKRNEEAKRKLMEDAAREEEEAMARAKAREEGEDAGPTETNYGPGDLSTLPSILTTDDSWEASLGDDDSGVIGGGSAGASGGEGGDDGPGLYVPGDEGDEPALFIPTEGGDGDGDSPILL